MTKLFIPSSVLEEYNEEGTLYKYSLQHDKKTTVSLPPFLAYNLQIDIDNLASRHVKGFYWEEYLERLKATSEKSAESARSNPVIFVTKPEEETFFPVQQRIIAESAEGELAKGYERYDSGQIKGRRVACRYVVTDLLMRGLYELHRRLEARLNNQNPDDYKLGSGEKKLKLISFRNLLSYGAPSIDRGLHVAEIKEERISFDVRGDKKEIVTIHLPRQVYGAIRRQYPLIDFSSFLAYCLALKHRYSFDEDTRLELFRESDLHPGAVQSFEIKILNKSKDLEQYLEEPEMRRITNERDLRAALINDLRLFRNPENPYTPNHLSMFIARHDLEATFGENVFAVCLKHLKQLEREGVIRRVAAGRGPYLHAAWQFVGKEE